MAILGALAWTPHLYSIIKKILTKSEIRAITSKTASLGFTTYGSIFNIRLAFSVKYHDIVISDLKIKIKHESGQEKIFEWHGLRQAISTMTTPHVGLMPNEKEHSVLAIKLNQKDIEEKIIECRDISYINGISELETNAIKKQTYLQQQNSYVEEEFLKSQEMVDLYSYMKQSLIWKTGKYIATLEVESPEEFNLIDNKYEFSLSAIDIEFFEKNKGQIEQSFESLKEDESNKVAWNWRNPSLKKQS